VLINKGIAHKNMEQFDLAVQCYNRALQIKPNDHVALYNLANCLARMSKNLEALEKYDAAIRLAPDCEKYKKERNAC
jgi:tetratricopeptide (TPR) repeat protein